MKIVPDMSLDEAMKHDYDAVILPVSTFMFQIVYVFTVKLRLGIDSPSLFIHDILDHFTGWIGRLGSFLR